MSTNKKKNKKNTLSDYGIVNFFTIYFLTIWAAYYKLELIITRSFNIANLAIPKVL